MALEELTDNVPIPFVGEYDINGVKGFLFLIATLVFGSGIYHMTDSIGERLASWANAQVAEITGENPATGQNTGPSGGAFD